MVIWVQAQGTKNRARLTPDFVTGSDYCGIVMQHFAWVCWLEVHGTAGMPYNLPCVRPALRNPLRV